MPRRDTRALILETSLHLFNELGEPGVSTNHIADEADISPGNLYYHFNSKDDIVLELFKSFLVQMQPLWQIDDESEPPTADDLWLRLHLMFEIMGRYRFLYRNLPDLHDRIPNFKKAFHGLLGRQRSTLNHLFDGLSARKILVITSTDREFLTENMLLAMTYWIPYAEIQSHPGLKDGSILNAAVARTLSLIVPFLADKEATVMQQLVQRYLD